MPSTTERSASGPAWHGGESGPVDSETGFFERGKSFSSLRLNGGSLAGGFRLYLSSFLIPGFDEFRGCYQLHQSLSVYKQSDAENTRNAHNGRV